MKINEDYVNEKILSSVIEGQRCFNEEEAKFFYEKISEGERQININNLDLNYYINIEQNLLRYIKEKIPEKEKKKHKTHLRFYLREQFYMNRYPIRKEIISKIQGEFYAFLNGVQSVEDINSIVKIRNFKYSRMNPEQNENGLIIENLKVVQSTMWDVCVRKMLEGIENTANLQKFPIFLLYNEKKILKYKIMKILKLSLDIPFDEVKISTEYIHSYLTKCFYQFFNENRNLFDDPSITKEHKKKIFQLLYTANKSYLQYHNNLQIFEENLKKYIYLIGLCDDYSEMSNEFHNYIQNSSNNDNDDVISSLYDELHFANCDKEDESSHPFYFLIFSFSCLLNNLTQYIESKDKEGKIEVTTAFTPQLMCSSRERQFLINLLCYIDAFLLRKEKKEICTKINYILENYVFATLIKSYTKVLFDENNKGKVELNFNRIYELVKQALLTEEEKNYKSVDEDMGDNILSKEQISLINAELQTFIKTNLTLSQKELEEVEHKDESTASSIFSFMKSGISSLSHQIISKDEISSFNISNLRIIPHDPFNISTHVCLCIYGIFYPDESKIPIKNIWTNLTGDKRNVDFYFYNWQNEDNFYKTNVTKNVLGYAMHFFSKNSVDYEQVNRENMKKMTTNNRKISKVYGKFLAYILVTRSIFKFHSISLLGYSLGCNVIKHCLKELKRLGEKGIKVNDIINNVIFIGGAAKIEEYDKHREIFASVSGKVVNCFSFYDNIIKDYYSNDSIGVRRINKLKSDETKRTYLPDVENIDLSSLKLNQDDYKNEIPNIISQIKEL